MELLVMLLVPFPLGLLLRSRGAAYITYLAVHAFVFPFQTLVLLIDWVNGAEAAFGPYPDASWGQVWGYGVLNLLICLGGLGLVALGQRVQTRRRRDRAGTGRGLAAPHLRQGCGQGGGGRPDPGAVYGRPG
jgi:hypothetical protein